MIKILTKILIQSNVKSKIMSNVNFSLYENNECNIRYANCKCIIIIQYICKYSMIRSNEKSVIQITV
jgi:hypothetical protein